MTDDPSVRAMHINQLKERIERSAYTVDADAVAEALLRRPAARRTILPAVSRAGARSRRANGSGPRS
jgi:Anti-sigma-28 factor, FlgM